MTGSRGNQELVIGYVRVSTDTDRQALGAQAQAAALQDWASKNGATLLQSFVEEVSGGASIERRPVLLQAIATVAAVGASGLLVAKLDRFSRCPVSAALAESELRKHGARLICADGNGDGTDATGELIRSILLSVAKFEKALTRSRIRAALQVKRAKGERVGAPPYGFKVEGKNLVPAPEEHAIKVRLRALRSSGMTIRAVRDRATAEGIRNRMGKPFTIAAVHAMVRDPAPAE